MRGTMRPNNCLQCASMLQRLRSAHHVLQATRSAAHVFRHLAALTDEPTAKCFLRFRICCQATFNLGTKSTCQNTPAPSSDEFAKTLQQTSGASQTDNSQPHAMTSSKEPGEHNLELTCHKQSEAHVREGKEGRARQAEAPESVQATCIAARSIHVAALPSPNARIYSSTSCS